MKHEPRGDAVTDGLVSYPGRIPDDRGNSSAPVLSPTPRRKVDEVRSVETLQDAT